ncbi:STAS-like domain-containing protein [Larkinella sp. GY13]|uniref:STAS-like domain-containing protein n=1 Tax=Larkinella sp. GY13 TaxID=3453720 RepID=UPI003EEA4B96
MKQLIVNIAKEFTKTPGPRYIWEGEFSGELFRQKILTDKFHQAVDQNSTLVVQLDGTAGYGTSFLEEVFGGLAREEGIKKVQKYLEVISNDEPYLKDDILEYVREAEKKKSGVY